MFKKFLVLLLVTSPLLSSAQLGKFINKVKDRVNQKATQRIDSRVDKAIDKTLDGVEGKTTASTISTAETDNSGTSKANKPKGLKSFSKYDFVPGEKVLYAEDFSQEAHC